MKEKNVTVNINGSDLVWHTTTSQDFEVAYTKPDESENIVVAHVRNVKTNEINEVRFLALTQEQSARIKEINERLDRKLG